MEIDVAIAQRKRIIESHVAEISANLSGRVERICRALEADRDLDRAIATAIGVGSWQREDEIQQEIKTAYVMLWAFERAPAESARVTDADVSPIVSAAILADALEDMIRGQRCLLAHAMDYLRMHSGYPTAN